MLAALTLVAAGAGAAPSTTIEVQAGKPLHQVRLAAPLRPPLSRLPPLRWLLAEPAERCARLPAGEQDVHGLSQRFWVRPPSPRLLQKQPMSFPALLPRRHPIRVSGDLRSGNAKT
eukprot:COSAG04_NODE_1589_length_6221_cov_4.460307_1_plen_115_part_10